MSSKITRLIPLESLYVAFKPEDFHGMQVFRPKLEGWVFKEVQARELNRTGKQAGGIQKVGPQTLDGEEMVRMMFYGRYVYLLIRDRVVLWVKGERK